MDALSGGGWGVFIAPTTKPTVGEARQPRHPTVRVLTVFDRWSTDFMSHRTIRCRTGQLLFSVWCVLTLRSDSTAHCCALFTLLQTTVALDSRCSAGAPDSSVPHQTVRWIIAERLSRNSKVACLKEYGPGHQTLSGGTPDSAVRQTRVLFGFFCSFLLNPNLIFLLVCVEPLAPVEYII
jgi:hypothetical protein